MRFSWTVAIVDMNIADVDKRGFSYESEGSIFEFGNIVILFLWQKYAASLVTYNACAKRLLWEVLSGSWNISYSIRKVHKHSFMVFSA